MLSPEVWRERADQIWEIIASINRMDDDVDPEKVERLKRNARVMISDLMATITRE